MNDSIFLFTGRWAWGIPTTCTDAKLWKAAKNLGLRERRPSRFYGNERREWPSASLAGDRAAELRKQEAREAAQPCTAEALGAVPAAARAERGGVCGCSPSTRAPSAAGRASANQRRLRKASEVGTATALPGPFPAS